MSLFDWLFGRRNGTAPMSPEIAEQTVKSDATLRASHATLRRVEKLVNGDFLADAELAEADRRARRKR